MQAPDLAGFSDDEHAEAAVSRFESMLGGSSDEGSGSEESDEEAPAPAKPQPAAKKPKSRPTETTFLPTLMGGYVSGDSESASDVDTAPPRKNRRGQRERQKIWEKKYKQNAKHLLNKKDDRSAGWDPVLGAVDEDHRTPWKRGMRNPLHKAQSRRDFAQETGAGRENGAPAPEKKQDLHPSWKAKKAREAAQSQAAYAGPRSSSTDSLHVTLAKQRFKTQRASYEATSV